MQPDAPVPDGCAKPEKVAARDLAERIVQWGLKTDSKVLAVIGLVGAPPPLASEGLEMVIKKTRYDEGEKVYHGFWINCNWPGWWYHPHGPSGDTPHAFPFALNKKNLKRIPEAVFRNFLDVINSRGDPSLPRRTWGPERFQVLDISANEDGVVRAREGGLAATVSQTENEPKV